VLKWSGKEDFYNTLLANGSLREEDREPNISVFSYYISCFWELDSTRSRSALAPIPFTAIAEYAKIYNEDIDEFLYLMRRLDRVYLQQNENKNHGKSN